MSLWVLIFLTFSHFNHESISCESCHNLKNPQKVLKTNNKTCNECHKSNPKIHYFTLKDKNGIKFKHESHQFLSCNTCHIVKKETISNPNMKTCTSCHDSKENTSKPDCASCHTYNKIFVTHYKDKIYKPISHQKFNYKTKHIVKNENYCLQCHKKSYCLDCHSSSSKFNSSNKFHPIDYLAIHKYEKNLNSCKSCHQKENDCKSCHQKAGIDTTDLVKQNRKYRVHKENWDHGKAAYKNINNCVSCHTENDCKSCHQTEINPHKKVKNICKRSVKQKRSCEKCHERVKDVCP